MKKFWRWPWKIVPLAKEGIKTHVFIDIYIQNYINSKQVRKQSVVFEKKLTRKYSQMSTLILNKKYKKVKCEVCNFYIKENSLEKLTISFFHSDNHNKEKTNDFTFCDFCKNFITKFN